MNLNPSAMRRSLTQDERGSIGMIGVLCMGAFACLLFALINLGVAVTEKVELQNATDASVISGATIVARGLNLIAMNNNAQVKLLALATLWFGLDKAIPVMKIVHIAYKAGCQALALIPFVGAALSFGCNVIVEIAKGILAIWEAVICNGKCPSKSGIMMQIFQYPNGIAWKIMKLLEKFSGIIANGTPILAAVEAWRIAKANKADFGMMVSPGILGGDVDGPTDLFLVDFPVHKGAFSDLCGPAKAYTAEVRKGPFMSWAWDIGVDPIAGGLGKLLGATGVAGAILDGFIAARYASQCGFAAANNEVKVPAELSICKQQGGIATWDKKIAILDREPGDPINPRPDPMLEEARVVSQQTITQSCTVRPPGTQISFDPPDAEQYQSVEKLYPLGGPYTDAYVTGQRITQWSFVKAEVTQDVGDGGSFDKGDSNLPKPYMLGKDGNEKPSETSQRLNYFSIAYREKGMALSPKVLKDMVWDDVRLTYAAARVYNATAFDSFTQDWRVKLVPADLQTFSDSLGSAKGKLSSPPSGLSVFSSSKFSSFSSFIDRIRESVPLTH